jgi:hypothetical protein
MEPGGGIGVDSRLLAESIEDMLRERQFAGPAVALLMHFPGLKLQFEAVDVMLTLATDGQLSTAQSWAVELGPRAQVRSVGPYWTEYWASFLFLQPSQ